MTDFDPTAYSPAIADLLREPRLMPLGPGTPNHDVFPQLRELTPEKLIAPHAVRDRDMARACHAALWLYHDFMDESHSVSQAIHTPTGSYWHALMHRREPDYGNSKYWFRRVGRHPVFEALWDAARELAARESQRSTAFLLLSSSWDPFAFIELCERAAAGRSPCQMLCRRIQQKEWEHLVDWCYRQARGQG